ncbi:MAG: choice-of-anchor E domain-containing protein [Phycisphaerae bacterium]
MGIRRALVLGLWAGLALASTAQASQTQTLTFGASVPIQLTNWNQNINIPKFDTALGTLQSIEFLLGGTVQGSAAFESLDAAPATVTLDLSATITLTRPDMSVLVVSLPAASTVDNVLAFDGLIDFGGASGRSYPNLSDTDTNSVTLGPPVSAADLALFSALGGGNIALPISAIATSHGSGAGNLLVQFTTLAGADVRVKYTYKAIPEPATLALILLGGPVLFRRTRSGLRIS